MRDCKSFGILAIGFGPDKDHITDVCDIGPGFGQPFCFRYQCDDSLIGQEILYVIDIRADDDSTVIQTVQGSFVVRDTDDIEFVIQIYFSDPGRYFVYAAIMTNDAECFAEVHSPLRVIRTPRPIYMYSIEFQTDNGFPGATLYTYPKSSLRIVCRAWTEGAAANVPLRFLFELSAHGSGQSEYQDTWSDQFSGLQTISKEYLVMPSQLASLCQGYHDGFFSLATVNGADKFEIRRDILVSNRTFGNPGTPPCT